MLTIHVEISLPQFIALICDFQLNPGPSRCCFFSCNLSSFVDGKQVSVGCFEETSVMMAMGFSVLIYLKVEPESTIHSAPNGFGVDVEELADPTH